MRNLKGVPLDLKTWRKRRRMKKRIGSEGKARLGKVREDKDEWIWKRKREEAKKRRGNIRII